MKLRFKRRLSGQQTITLLLIALAVGLLLYKLGSLVPGLAASEYPLSSVQQIAHQTWDNPLALPYKLSQLMVAAVLPTSGYTASRLPAVLLGLATLGVMAWVLKQWYGQRLALFGTALMMTAPWLLHVARLADGDILYPLAMTTVLALAAAWHKKQRPSRLLPISALAAALLLYIPGGVWLLLCLALIEGRNIIESIKAAKLTALGAGALGLASLLPLVNGLVQNWRTYLYYLGGTHRWAQLTDYPLHFVRVWQHIFIGGYRDPVHNLGSLPVVSTLMTLAFVVGLYLYGQHPKAARTRLLGLLWVVGTALISLPNGINIALILPILVVLTTGGLGYLLHLWLKVFPRNPLARGFGIGLVALVVVFGVAYNLRNYYVAWPHNAATRAAFSSRL